MRGSYSGIRHQYLLGPEPDSWGHDIGALAEFERNLIRERTQAGLMAARARGRHGGHPRVAAFRDEKKVAQAISLYNDKTNSIADICSTFRISRATPYRYIARYKAAHRE